MNYSDPFGLCPPTWLCQVIAGFVAREALRPYVNRPELANIEQSADRSVLHTMGSGGGNKKYLSADGHHESVRSPTGVEVAGKNAATYNFGTGPMSHAVMDVAPWIVVGTRSPGDDTTMPGRIKKMVSAIFVKPCVQDSVCQ